MYCVEREYLREEMKQCCVCNKWIEKRYVLLVEPDEQKYFHIICYKYLSDLTYL